MNEIVGFSFTFPPEYLKAALLLSLLSVWVLVALFAYLNLYTRRRYFTLWTAAWLFYAIWLTLCLSIKGQYEGPMLMTIKLWCVSASAVCLMWGSSVFHSQRLRELMVGLFTAFLFLWSYGGAHYLGEPLLVKLPIFVLIGLVSIMTAWTFYKFRVRRDFIGAGLLVVGFALWGVYLAAYPLIQLADQLISATFLISAVVQLFIAVSMIILVLEEARSTNKLAFQQIQTQKSEKAVLQRKMVSTEERYRKLFEQAHEGIIITAAADLQILEMNHTAIQLLGINPASAKSPRLASFLRAATPHDPMPTASEDWFNWVANQHHLTLSRHDGSLVEVEVDGARVELDGNPAFQFFFREMTERARLEQQLRQAERLSAIGQMISGIAHELNNPLSVVMGYLELILQRHELSSQSRVDLEKVAKEANRAVKLINNFLSLAREQPSRRELVDLNQTVKRVMELRHAELRCTGIELDLDLNPRLPRTVVDPDKLQQVLVILVNNAVQAMLDMPSPGRLKITTETSGRLLRIKVSDTGPGVPPAIQSRIFEPFFTTKEVGTGTGLGLSIAHSIMTEHQGRLALEPTASGACFVLEFPLVNAVPPGTAAAPAPLALSDPSFDSRPPTPPPASRPARILVLDDEKSIAELLGEMLGLLGYETVVCNSGQQALGELDRGEFDVILSDYRMPGMDGQEFYELASQKHQGVPRRIIFLTGDVVNEETRAFLDSIGASYLGKPFHLDKVEAAVAQVLKDHPQPASA